MAARSFRLTFDVVDTLADAETDGYELELGRLHAVLWRNGHRHGGIPRVASTLAMLETAGLVWTERGVPGAWPRKPGRVGLTQKAVEVLTAHGRDALRDRATRLAKPIRP